MGHTTDLCCCLPGFLHKLYFRASKTTASNGDKQSLSKPPPSPLRNSKFCQIWHSNMPYNKIADRKDHQGWMKKEGQHFISPGGGTMFLDGAVQYIEKLKQYIPITGGVLRTALDMGCGLRTPREYMLGGDHLNQEDA